jgi:hypothetical protein
MIGCLSSNHILVRVACIGLVRISVGDGLRPLGAFLEFAGKSSVSFIVIEAFRFVVVKGARIIL